MDYTLSRDLQVVIDAARDAAEDRVQRAHSDHNINVAEGIIAATERVAEVARIFAEYDKAMEAWIDKSLDFRADEQDRSDIAEFALDSLRAGLVA